MHINTETFGNVLVAHTPDELSEDTLPELREVIERHIESGLVKVVLQMDRSEQYDSVGLTALVELQEELRQRGGNVKVSGLADPGLTIFKVTRLDRQFDVFDSVVDAVSSYQ